MSQNINFEYKYTNGDTWASGIIGTDKNKFEFVCSYLFNNPLEKLLNSVYQIVPNLAAFPRKEIDFIMLNEPIEYRWKFKLLDEKNVSINIYEKGYDLKTELIFEEYFNFYHLLKALIQCISNNPELRTNERIERIYKEFKLHLKNQ